VLKNVEVFDSLFSSHPCERSVHFAFDVGRA
jgi:hypothetical protein